MAGYSGKSVVQKLGIKPGFRIFVAGAPADYEMVVGTLPEQVVIASRVGGRIDVIHAFATRQADLDKKLPAYRRAIEPAGMLWISWPKKASGVATDLTENVLRDLALPLELVDVKVCAIDATWSGLKFVVRTSERARKD
jgi:hypothetical protein